MSNNVKLFIIHLSLIGTLILFQNCGSSFDVAESPSLATINPPDQNNEEGTNIPPAVPENPTTPSLSIQPRLSATRLSGFAPLAVQFDATESTASGVTIPFHFLRYEFNFGDPRGQTWGVSGNQKNIQIGGPLSAYVFDLPGTYTVRLRVINPANNESQETSLSITVQDPNVIFSGQNTICVSVSSNFTGCPSGALQNSTIPTITSNKRILLRRGETFGSISVPHGTNQVLISSFGSGNKPRVHSVSIGALGPPNNQFPSDIAVVDLNILNSYTQMVTGSRLLLYRCDFPIPTDSGVNAQITIASALPYIVQNHTLPASQYIQPREIFIVENNLTGSISNPFVNMFGEGSKFVILGNRMGAAQQHTIRIFAMHKGYIAHNHLRGISSDGIRVALKLHSGGLGEYNDNYGISGAGWASRQIVIANNLLGDPADNNSFTGGAGPQNNGPNSREGVEDVILENNRFHRGPNTNTEFILMGRRMTTRGNTRIDGGQVNINQFGNSFQLLPPEWNGPYYIQ